MGVNHGGVANLKVFLCHLVLTFGGSEHIFRHLHIVLGKPRAEVSLHHAGDEVLLGLCQF